MQIVEVKNDTTKIIYNPAEINLLPSDFILIDDSKYKLITQVINIETENNSENNLAVLKASLFIDSNDNLSYYNGYVPAKNAKLIHINPNEIISLMQDGNNINFGTLSNHTDCMVSTDISVLDKKLYIQSDRNDTTNTVVKNLVSELGRLNKKTVIVDFNKHFEGVSNCIINIANDLKLPLNTYAFDTILKKDISDCPIEDKVLIQSIILELRDYLKTVNDKFIPFNLFKKVVDDEFLNNPISGLMLLRNKLWFYSQDAIFADFKHQFDFINSKLNENKTIYIDASGMPEKWYEFILKTVIDLIDEKCYLFFSLNDFDTDKKSIEQIYNSETIIPVITISYENKYSNILKSLCSNRLLCKPSFYNNEHEDYTSLINKMNNDEILLYGETTLYLPLLADLTKSGIAEFSINVEPDEKQNNTKETIIIEQNEDTIENTEPLNEDIDLNLNNENDNNSEISEEPINSADDDFNDEDFDFLDEIALSEEQENNIENETKTIISEEMNSEVNEENEIIEDLNEKSEEQISDIETENEEINIEPEETIEILEPQEAQEIDEGQNTEDELNIDEEPTEQDSEIVSIDDVIGDIKEKIDINKINEAEEDTIQTEPEQEEPSAESNPSDINQHSAEEKTENNEVNPENSAPLYEESKNKIMTHKSPDIQVYETDIHNPLSVDDLPFKVGDKVYHPKHGKGIVEGFANYSNKILFCQIEFENVGRRILDPRIAGIEKIS